MKTTVEEWRPIKGYEGFYEVSNFGRIKSLDRYVNGRWGKTFRKGFILKPVKAPNGYLHICLISKQYQIHRLVARAFPDICGKWFEGCVINHLNTKRDDNRAVNLRVTTQYENVHWADGIEKCRKANLNNPKYSKRVAQYTLEGKLVAIYPSTMEAQRQTGIANSLISGCCLGKYKTAGEFIWRYLE